MTARRVPSRLLLGDLAVWDGHVAMMVGNGTMVEATETDDGLAKRAGLILHHRVRQVGLPKHQGPQSVRSSIGYANRNSTMTAAGNELTGLELIEVPVVARGANHRESGRG